jgi:Transposase
MQITTIGLDIAKNVFQVHGIDAKEKVVARKQLRRSQVITFFKALPPCLIGMEACATAHYWARELTKLGHEVRLMPAKDVKAYVKRNKNDAADAEAICEAVRRPTMRFVRIKTAEQQGQLMQHRTRDVLIRQRTQIINALRAHLAELGLVAAQGNAVDRRNRMAGGQCKKLHALTLEDGWEWRAFATSRPNGLVNARCLDWPRCNLPVEPSLCLRRCPFPGNGIPSPETTRSKTPARYHWWLQRLEPERRSPPVRGYLPAARKSPQTRDCVVGLGGLEPQTRPL